MRNEQTVLEARLQKKLGVRGFRLPPVSAEEFTRPDSKALVAVRHREIPSSPNIAPISARHLDWLPAIEVRGEGIFLELEGVALAQWKMRVISHSPLDAFSPARDEMIDVDSHAC